MPRILVLASETIGGGPLLDAIRRRGEGGDVSFHIVVPQTRPRHGNVVYDDAVRDAAQVRVDLALAFLRGEGLRGQGEVGDEDPFNAAMDAMDGIDEIIVSTRPLAQSGWLRRDLPERLREATGLPVEHVVVDLDTEGLPFDVTLVAANQTVATPELVERLKAKAAEGPRRFIIVIPQDAGDGRATVEAKERLKALLRSLQEADIVAAGFIGDPDPYTAIMNAVQVFFISEIVISTLPESSSKWMQKGLPDRVRRSSGRPVEHVAAKESEAVGAGNGAG